MVIPCTLEYQSPWENTENWTWPHPSWGQNHVFILSASSNREMGRWSNRGLSFFRLRIRVAAELCIVKSDLVRRGEVRTWIMDVIWTLGDPINCIRVSKGCQTIQMERVAAVCKPPKNREVFHRINGGDWNWNAAGCAPESFRWWAKLRVWRTAWRRRRTCISGHGWN